MCKSKMKTGATEPNQTPPPPPRRSSQSTAANPSSSSSSSRTTSSSSRTRKQQQQQPNRFLFPNSNNKPTSSDDTSTSYGGYDNNYTTNTNTNSISNNNNTTTSSNTSRSSLSSLRDSLPETAYIYDFSEISSATNNFLAKRFSTSRTPAWRCSLRGKDVLVFQRKFIRSIETSELRERLSFICKSHHMSLIKLLGASISGDHIYLVYDFVNGANLADCLRNPRNPGFTVLSNWISRMQIATDLAQGLEYIHHYTGLKVSHVHNHIKSSSLIITQPSFNAKICHFGTAELCGEIIHNHHQSVVVVVREEEEEGEISLASPCPKAAASASSKQLKKSDSRNQKFQGTRGYMSPEFQSGGGIPTQKSDIFAFGVVILELLSGEEPLKYRFDKENGDYRRVSVIETAREVINMDQEEEEEVAVSGRLRRWIDRRLKDSFPLEVAEKMIRLALDCVDTDPDKRPDMGRVAGKMSTYYLKSIKWAQNMKVPTGISVSLGPR